MKNEKDAESRIHSLEQRVSFLENRVFGVSKQKEVKSENKLCTKNVNFLNTN